MNTKSLKTTVGLKELRANMETYIKRVQNGDSITVFRRSTPLFNITPVTNPETQWETVLDFTELNPNGVSGKDILEAIKKIDG